MTIFLAVISGIILGFAFPPFNCWYIAWLGLVPAFLALSENRLKTFIAGWAAGFAFHTFLLFWLTKVAGPVYLLLPVYLGLYWGLFFYLLSALPEKGRVFLAPAVWFFMEILIAHVLTGFPWLPLGLSQHRNPALLPAARFLGTPGLSALVILGNATLAFGFRKKHVVSLCFSLAAFAGLFVALHYFPLRLNPTSSLKILAVQSNIASRRDVPPAEVLRRYYIDTAAILKKEKTDLVIWPESSYSDVLTDNRPLLDALVRLARAHRCAILLGTIGRRDEALYNTALLIRPSGKLSFYHKTHLVPYGEFILGERFAWIKRTYERIAGYTPCLSAGNSLQPFDIGGRPVGPLVCFENIFPGIARESVENGSRMFIVITNDSWFKESFGPYQHFAHNVLRSVETGRYFLQAASTGITGVAAPDGMVSILTGYENGRKSEIFVRGYLVRSVPLIAEKTPYTRYGDLPLTLIFLTLTGALLCRK